MLRVSRTGRRCAALGALGLSAALCSLALVAGAAAHDYRPLTLIVEDAGPDRFALRAAAPASLPPAAQPRVTMAPPCVPAAGTGEGVVYRCPPGAAVSLRIDYPGGNPSLSSLVRFVAASGAVSVQLAPPDVRRIELAREPGRRGAARAYAALGVKHVLVGADHLLFLACLMILCGQARRTLIAATGFTLAHSATLSLAALGAVRVPIDAVETGIALSIVVLAAEAARGRGDTLVWRRPILAASLFGLLHGLGFAAALEETGLPSGARVTALASFNVGVEVGQALFLTAAGALAWAGLRLAARAGPAQGGRRLGARRLGERAIAYGSGIAAAVWTFERAWA